MDEELSLPSVEAEAPIDEDDADGDDEGAAAGMKDGEAGGEASDDGAAKRDDADPKDGQPAAGGAPQPAADKPAADASAPDTEPAVEEKQKEKVGDAISVPSQENGPLDPLLDPSAGPATSATRAPAENAWSELSRGPSDDRPQGRMGSVVRTSGPAEEATIDRGDEGRSEMPKYRSPGQKMAEENGGAAGRWRAKAAAVGAMSGGVPANPLRGVTAQPGNPLR